MKLTHRARYRVEKEMVLVGKPTHYLYYSTVLMIISVKSNGAFLHFILKTSISLMEKEHYKENKKLDSKTLGLFFFFFFLFFRL